MNRMTLAAWLIFAVASTSQLTADEKNGGLSGRWVMDAERSSSRPHATAEIVCRGNRSKGTNHHDLDNVRGAARGNEVVYEAHNRRSRESERD